MLHGNGDLKMIKKSKSNSAFFVCVMTIFVYLPYLPVNSQDILFGDHVTELKEVATKKRFVFMNNSLAGKRQLLECPNHAFGSIQEGKDEIAKRKLSAPRPWLVQYCIYGQRESIKAFSPMVDQVGLNPLVSEPIFDEEKPAKDTEGNFYLERFFEIRKSMPNQEVFARIDLLGKETLVLNKRSLTSLEIEWLILSLSASGFDGIIWVATDEEIKNIPGVRRLESKYINGILYHGKYQLKFSLRGARSGVAVLFFETVGEARLGRIVVLRGDILVMNENTKFIESSIIPAQDIDEDFILPKEMAAYLEEDFIARANPGKSNRVEVGSIVFKRLEGNKLNLLGTIDGAGFAVDFSHEASVKGGS